MKITKDTLKKIIKEELEEMMMNPVDEAPEMEHGVTEAADEKTLFRRQVGSVVLADLKPLINAVARLDIDEKKIINSLIKKSLATESDFDLSNKLVDIENKLSNI